MLKHEARRVANAAEALAPFQDEKHDIYHRHNDKMSVVFERAREVRKQIQTEDEARNKLILDMLEDMKATTEAATRTNLENLKAYSTSFDERLDERKQAYRAQLKIGYNVNNRRAMANAADFVRLDELIKKEHEECIEQAHAETGPILEALEDRRQNLARTQQERVEAYEAYKVTLRAHFERLRQTLKEEAVARREQCATQRTATQARVDILDGAQDAQDAAVKKKLEELRATLEDEKVDTSASNQMVTSEMTDFIALFQRAIAASVEKQAATKKHLMALKTQMQLET